MSISNDSIDSESDSNESDDDFQIQTILHVPLEGHQYDKTIETSIQEFNERTTKSSPYQTTNGTNEEQLLHQVNVAVMEAVICMLSGLGLNPAKMDDDKLLCYINYVIKNIPYKQNIRYGSVDTRATEQSCHSK